MNKELLDTIAKDEVIAIIPARGGSKSVPKKNIRCFQGYPLIAYSIAVAKLSKTISRVIVSTDSEEIAEIGKKYGAEVPFLRPSELAQDDSPDIDFVKHAIRWFDSNEGKIPQYFVHLRPTTPLRYWKDIDKAVAYIMKDTEATSLRSGERCIHPPYKWLIKDNSEYLKPLMPGMTCDETNLPRQKFAEVYIPNGYVDVLKTDFVIKNELMHGDRMLLFETDETLDIDTENDLNSFNGGGRADIILQELCTYLEKV